MNRWRFRRKLFLYSSLLFFAGSFLLIIQFLTFEPPVACQGEACPSFVKGSPSFIKEEEAVVFQIERTFTVVGVFLSFSDIGFQALVPYVVRIFDKDKTLTIKKGEFQVQSGDSSVLLIPDVVIKQGLPDRVSIEYDIKNIEWTPFSALNKEDLLFETVGFEIKEDGVLLETKIINNTPQTIRDITPYALVRNEKNNLVGVTRTYIPEIAGNDVDTIYFVWDHVFRSLASQCRAERVVFVVDVREPPEEKNGEEGEDVVGITLSEEDEVREQSLQIVEKVYDLPEEVRYIALAPNFVNEDVIEIAQELQRYDDSIVLFVFHNDLEKSKVDFLKKTLVSKQHTTHSATYEFLEKEVVEEKEENTKEKNNERDMNENINLEEDDIVQVEEESRKENEGVESDTQNSEGDSENANLKKDDDVQVEEEDDTETDTQNSDENDGSNTDENINLEEEEVGREEDIATVVEKEEQIKLFLQKKFEQKVRKIALRMFVFENFDYVFVTPPSLRLIGEVTLLNLQGCIQDQLNVSYIIHQ